MFYYNFFKTWSDLLTKHKTITLQNMSNSKGMQNTTILNAALNKIEVGFNEIILNPQASIELWVGNISPKIDDIVIPNANTIDIKTEM